MPNEDMVGRQEFLDGEQSSMLQPAESRSKFEWLKQKVFNF